jgi:hypothetical protein
MVELDNGQEEHFKPGRHNAKLCPLVIRERIINALAAPISEGLGRPGLEPGTNALKGRCSTD